jgi:glycosyltransferase involved in cell wall biosynthesis
VSSYTLVAGAHAVRGRRIMAGSGKQSFQEGRVQVSGIIVHEWISKTGGSEKVLDAMVKTFPDAEVWCLWNDVPQSRYPERIVRESWLARTPLRRSRAAALPFMPLTWRTHRSSSAEWILASSHLFAHHVSLGGLNPDVRKFAYVHTPARYIWNHELDGRGAGWLPRLVSPSLRSLDRRRAQESYRIAANSQCVRERIKVAWHRDSEVIYPPVDVARIQRVASWADELCEAERPIFDAIPSPYVLGASRFVPYKRLDLVIRTGEAADVPVVLAGSGPEDRRLREQAAQARVPVYFVSAPSDALLYALYESASVFVFPAIEDFGIMPVEAMAIGTPVVGRQIGGVSETVIDGVTGAHLPERAGPKDLKRAFERALDTDSEACRSRAQAFDGDRFADEIRSWKENSEGPSRVARPGVA